MVQSVAGPVSSSLVCKEAGERQLKRQRTPVQRSSPRPRSSSKQLATRKRTMGSGEMVQHECKKRRQLGHVKNIDEDVKKNMGSLAGRGHLTFLEGKSVSEKDLIDAINKVIKGYSKFSATPKYMVYN